MLKYELLLNNYYMKGQLYNPTFRAGSLHPVLAIHKQECKWSNSTTLNPKAARKIGFPLSKTYWTWIKNCTRNNNLCSKSFDTKVSLILQEGHIMLIPLMVKLLFAKWPNCSSILLDNKLAKDSNYRFRCTSRRYCWNFCKNLMCLPFQHMVKLTTHLKRNFWLRYCLWW
jgi:hypothetical protein